MIVIYTGRATNPFLINCISDCLKRQVDPTLHSIEVGNAKYISEHLDKIKLLILPGGNAMTMGEDLAQINLAQRVQNINIWAICAGAMAMGAELTLLVEGSLIKEKSITCLNLFSGSMPAPLPLEGRIIKGATSIAHLKLAKVRSCKGETYSVLNWNGPWFSNVCESKTLKIWSRYEQTVGYHNENRESCIEKQPVAAIFISDLSKASRKKHEGKLSVIDFIMNIYNSCVNFSKAKENKASGKAFLCSYHPEIGPEHIDELLQEESDPRVQQELTAIKTYLIANKEQRILELREIFTQLELNLNN